MPLPSIALSYVEILIKGIITGGGSNSINTVNTFHFRRTTTVNPLDKNHINTAFQASVGADLIACLNNRWSQQTNEIRFINDAEDAYQPFTAVNAGAIAGDGMSSVASVFLYMRSGYRGRSLNGSKKLGPLSESDTTAAASDVLNAAAITRWGTLASTIQVGFTDSDGNVWVPCIVSRLGSQLSKNPTFVSAFDCIQVLLNKRIGRNRRREVASVY